MGIFKAAATAVSALGGVGSTVFGLVRGVGKIGSGLFKSTIGKFAIGAGVAALLAGNPMSGKGGTSFFDKIADGFKSFIGGIGRTVSKKAGGAALTAASAVAGVGTAVNKTAETIENDDSRVLSLRDIVIDQNFEAPDDRGAPSETVKPDVPKGPDEPVSAPELC